MKNIPVIALLLTFAACTSKNTSTSTNTGIDTVANAHAVAVSMKGISDFNIGMTKEAIEKLLKHALSLHQSTDSMGSNLDTVSCKWKEVDYRLIFSKETDTANVSTTLLYEIMSSSPLLKTPSGIGIGDDICKITTAYVGHRINIAPDFEFKNEKVIEIKGKTRVWLFNDSDHSIIFHMNNNAVEAISVSLFEGD